MVTETPEDKFLEEVKKDLDEIHRHQGKAMGLVGKLKEKINDYERRKIQPPIPEKRG